MGIFFVIPPTEPCTLRSTQPLKVSTRDFSWGKGGRCVWLTNYHPFSAETSRKSGVFNYAIFARDIQLHTLYCTVQLINLCKISQEAALSKTLACGRSFAGICGSNPAESTVVFLLCFVSYR